jgi:hypothetical protein
MDGVEQAVRLRFEGDAIARVLWYLGWYPVPLSGLFVCMAGLGWLVLRHPAGLVVGFVAFFPYWKAVQLVSKGWQGYRTQAESLVREHGAAILGISLDDTQSFIFSVGKGKAPFAVASNAEYDITAVYVCDSFFAVYQPSILRLPQLDVQLSPQGEEFYFRQISVVNYNPPNIQVTLSNGKTSRQFPIGLTGNSAVLQLLRARLRGKAVPSVTAPQSAGTLAGPESDSSPASSSSNTNETRYCYLRLGKLQQLLSDPFVLDALLDQLGVPGERQVLRNLTPQEKMENIETWADNLRRSTTSIWSEVPRLEVIAAQLWRAHLQFEGPKSVFPKNLVRRNWFCEVSREADLQIPIAKWLKVVGYEPYTEIPLGRARVDVLGYRKPALTKPGQLIAIELKNEYEQFKRAMDQMGTFSEYANLVYMACTPDFAASFLDQNERSTKHWDPSILDRRLRSAGVGLLIVEREQVFEVIEPTERNPPSKNSLKVVDALSPSSLIEC